MWEDGGRGGEEEGEAGQHNIISVLTYVKGGGQMSGFKVREDDSWC